MSASHPDTGTASFAGWDTPSLTDPRRQPYGQRLTEALRALGPAALADRAREAHRLLHEAGTSYNVYGAADGERQPWPLDIVPLLIGSDDWASIEAGLIQRAELLNLILTDLYGPREVLRRGLLPPALLYGHCGFVRACQDIRLPTAHQLLLYAADLARDRDGRTLVLADRTQAPSGLGYALENRRVTARVLPSLYRDAQVHRQEPFLRTLRGNLLAAAPAAARTDPVLALLTPGARNETYFEHTLLAQQLGLQLVEGSDLVMRGGRLRLRALGGLRPVDVLWRRLDDTWCDPLELRADSFLGVPGLVEAARRHQVSVVNPLGSGVLENAALGVYLPALARHFLGQDLRLPNVESYWCGDPQQLQQVLDRLPRLVIKRIDRRAGERSVFGASLDREGLAAWRERLRAQPQQYAAQAAVTPMQAPSFAGGEEAGRPVLLRAFLTAGTEGYRVLAGGFARVSLRDDTLFISNQAGALGKDVWVLASEPEAETLRMTPMAPGGVAASGLPRRAAENLFWVGRYLDRACASLRLLRLTLARLAEGDTALPAGGAESQDLLLQALTRRMTTHPGVPGVEPSGADSGTRLGQLSALLCDPALAGSLAHDLQALAQAAEAVREHLPPDALLLLADLPTRLPELELATEDRDPLGVPVQRLWHGLLALCGALAESGEHGTGWRFFELGRCIERGQNLIVTLRRLLCVPMPDACEPHLLEAALDFADCLAAYRRRDPQSPARRAALELLLQDPRQPRGLARPLLDIEHHLEALPEAGDGTQLSPANRLALDASSRLRLLDLTSCHRALDRSGLDQFFAREEYLLRSLSDTLVSTHFQPPRTPQPLLRVPAGQP